MKSVAILVLEGTQPFGVVAVHELFSQVRSSEAERLYDVRLCGTRPAYKVGIFDLRVADRLHDVAGADIVIIPGVGEATAEFGADVLDWVRDAARRGARLASICTGAFVLAAAGVLDGLRATLRWRNADELARRFPKVTVDPNVLFVDNGQILTSGPAVAAIDMCLHVIRQDYGAAAAAQGARAASVPLERDGTQAQLIVFHPHDAGVRFAELLQWMGENLGRDLTIDAIAKRAGMSTRTLRRRFHEQTRKTPKQWLLDVRIRRAQELLETGRASVDAIAREVGFRSSAVFRDRFSEVVGLSPSAYRRAMQPTPHAAGPAR